MTIQPPSNIFDMTKSLMKLQEKYLESIRTDYKLSRIEVIIITFLHNNPAHDTARDIVAFRMTDFIRVGDIIGMAGKKNNCTLRTSLVDRRSEVDTI